MSWLSRASRWLFNDESTPATVNNTPDTGRSNAELAGAIPTRGQTGPRGSADLEEEGWLEKIARVGTGMLAGGAVGAGLGGLLGGPLGAVFGGIGGAIFGGMESTHISEAWGDPQVLEADGSNSTVYDITGGPGTDMTDQGSGDYGNLLMQQAQNGVFPSLVPETHRELMDTSIPQAARNSLDALGQEVHNPFETGVGAYNIDEYSMVMDQLPEGFDTPEEFLASFLQSPNDMAGHHDIDGLDFDTYNEFYPHQAGTNNPLNTSGGAVPGIGDWYNIQIPGNDGDVMVVDSANGEGRSSATVQTMTDDEVGPMVDHPVSGRRQFGMEEIFNEDGSSGGYRFYTRGFDRQTNTPMDPQVSNMGQHGDWQALMESMALQHGGQAERTDEDGNPIWGWARQVSGEGLATSMDSNGRGAGSGMGSALFNSGRAAAASRR